MTRLEMLTRARFTCRVTSAVSTTTYLPGTTVVMASSAEAVDHLVAFRYGLWILTRSHWSWLAAALVFPLSLFAWFTISWATSPLRRYPGPLLAGYSNLWRLAQVFSGRYHLTIKELHDKYGPVVRIGPNTLDLDYPELIKTIYGTDGRWRKTEFYHNNSTIVNGKTTFTVFSMTDQAEHARMKRPVVKYYSLSHVLGIEPHMDTVISDLLGHLDRRFANTNKECDLGEWIAFSQPFPTHSLIPNVRKPHPPKVAWDFISSASFSRRYGYMDAGHDFDGTIAAADKTLNYFSAVSQIPWLDYLLDKNPVLRIGPPNLANATRIALEALTSRIAATTQTQGRGKDMSECESESKSESGSKSDYLQHFLACKTTYPDLVDDNAVLGYLLINVLAGADTTAITLRAVLYFTLKHRETVYRRLAAEVRAAAAAAATARFDSARPAPYAAARQMPYLEAVVREAMRCHPAVAMLLERYVPEGGLALPDGSSCVPAGTAVGMNAYVVQRNRAVWGPDADDFHPERWLRADDGETEAQYRVRLQKMNAADLTFGGGSRVCIGRHLALVEVYKLVATLLNRYDMELAHPEREWTVTNRWFARQTGLIVKLRLRE
ncbi:cytochrome P450 [Chaetomium strumarium]|uniref:Cytochrome P450 n=1 Tax=Chaetomium strumarium TaxID=1170767 RepID=A0AAJ0GVB7_9PEZI|nr:cytochrome P450 [Chaetomium strumarium]